MKKLKQTNDIFLHIPYSRFYNHYILRGIAQNQEFNQEAAFKLFEKHLTEAKKEVDKHWPGTKFIVLNYDCENEGFNTSPGLLNKDTVKKLTDDGFIVINTYDLTNVRLDKDYEISETNGHPNEKAWDLLTPLFVKKLETL